MSAVETIFQGARSESRAKRARVFRAAFNIGPATRILDFGAGNGANIAAVLAGTGAQPKNVYIASSDAEQTQQGHRNFGFVPIALPEAGQLPFEDGFFDIVYCASMMEQVVTSADLDLTTQTEQEFQEQVHASRHSIANEVRRLGRGYYVQTPHKWFPLHVRTWLPFIDYLPRRAQLQVLSLSNRYWFRRATPNWQLLTATELQQLFPEADIRRERFMGLARSIMAIRI